MTEEDLHRPQIARSLVDQRHLGSAEAVGAVGRAAQADTLDPVTYQPGILSRADVLGAVDAAGEDEIPQAAFTVGKPGDQAVSRLLGQFKLHRLAGLLLNGGRAVLCSCQEHHAAIGSDASTIECSGDFLASDGWKNEALNCIVVHGGCGSQQLFLAGTS